MKNTLLFLSELYRNNNKPWFDAHKGWYRDTQARFNDFACELIERMGAVDPAVKGLTLKDCTYRIYKDLRFSHDKLPYKTHFGVFICPGGKRSGHSGYYFHVEPAGQNYLGGHMLCCGAYCPQGKVLKSIREEFEFNGEEIVGSIEKAKKSGFDFSWDGALKKVPQGFPADSLYSEYFKIKAATVVKRFDDKWLLRPQLASRVVAAFTDCIEFNTILNRAIDFAIEEM